MAAKQKVIELGGVKYNGDWLRSVSEQKAVSTLRAKHDVNQIKNAHKQANGLSVRNHTKADKPAAKKTASKKA